MTKGNIFIDGKGIDVSKIDVGQRNQVLSDFFEMNCCAESNGDDFFRINEQEWDVFYNTLYTEPYWEGVSANLVNGLQNDFRQPKLLVAKADFCQKPDPKTNGGLKYQGHPATNYIFDIKTWRKWHYDWLYCHPEYIVWGKNVLWPRLDLVICMLKEELKKHNISIPKNDIDVGNAFHEEIMKHYNNNRIRSRAQEIVEQLCKTNYYHREKELERLEKTKGNKCAEVIFSIKKYGESTGNGKYQFISIDKQHGMLELCDDNGKHLGEYRFNGTPNGRNTQETDHSLMCVNEWKRKYNK